MHICDDFQNRLIETAFDQVDAAVAAGLRAEAEECPECAELLHTLQATATTIGEAFETDRPDEAYWTAYADRLDARLVAATPFWRRWWLAFSRMFATVLPEPFQLPAAVATLTLAIGVGAWMLPRLGPSKPSQTAKSPVTSLSNKVDFGQALDPMAPTREVATAPAAAQPIPPETNRVAIHLPRVPATPGASRDDETDTVLPVSAAAAALTRHVENAQLFLRAFRNTDLVGDQETLDLAYEKRLSRTLLTQNILLRRDAEARGNLPVEDALSALETILLDIANLSESATPDDLRQIQERIRRGEIIATLQALNQSAANLPSAFPSPPALPADEE